METQTFKIDNYITVPGFAIVDMGLSGNELLCYALIYGFTQDGETEFRGSLSYVSSALNVTRQNAKKILDRLVDRGAIEKKEVFFSGVKFCHYVAKKPSVVERATGCCQNSNGGVIERATNNNKDTSKDNTIDMAHPSSEFAEWWNTLCKEPKWKHKSKQALTMAMNKLAKMSEQEAIVAMKKSIEMSWQGIFPPTERDMKGVVRTRRQEGIYISDLMKNEKNRA